MNVLMEKIAHNAADFLKNALILSKRVDYRTLSRYMLGIQQTRDLEGVLKEAAKCLKDLMNYRLFSFALCEAGQVDLWIDPSVYKDSLGGLIEKDFAVSSDVVIHDLYESSGEPRAATPLRREDLLSYRMSNTGYSARIYVVPERRMLAYHGEIMEIILKTFSIALANLMNIKRLENDAAIDPLTNCYNKRELDRLIESYVANAKRYGNQLSVIMFDLDHFKRINDALGHHAGDEVLKEVSRAILSEIRKGDFLSRYGGEEFVAILPETTRGRAIELAERLRKKIASLDVKTSQAHVVKVTASFGVASLKKDADKDRLLMEADAFLYKAKASGRNTVMPQMKLLTAKHGRRRRPEPQRKR